MMTIQAINPATSEVLKTYEEMAPATVKDIVSKTHEAFLGWRRTTFSDRAGLMRKAAEILRANAGEYAHLMAQEMGKPVRDGVAEAQKCASGCDFYAEHAERFLAREPVTIEARKSFVTFNPLGVILAVMPWNFPVLAGLPFRCARSDGGERGGAQACVQRAGLRARNRRRLPPRRLPREFVPHPDDRQPAGRRGH